MARHFRPCSNTALCKILLPPCPIFVSSVVSNHRRHGARTYQMPHRHIRTYSSQQPKRRDTFCSRAPSSRNTFCSRAHTDSRRARSGRAERIAANRRLALRGFRYSACIVALSAEHLPHCGALLYLRRNVVGFWSFNVCYRTTFCSVGEEIPRCPATYCV